METIRKLTVGLVAGLVLLGACSEPEVVATNEPPSTTGAIEEPPATTPAPAEIEALATVEAVIAAYNDGDIESLDELVGLNPQSDPTVGFLFGPRYHVEAKMAANASFTLDGDCAPTEVTDAGAVRVDCSGIERYDFIEAAGIEIPWEMTFTVYDGYLVDGEGPGSYDSEGRLLSEGEDGFGGPYGPSLLFAGSFMRWFYATYPEVAGGLPLDSEPPREGLPSPPLGSRWPITAWDNGIPLKSSMPTVLEYVDEFVASGADWVAEARALELAEAFLEARANEEYDQVAALSHPYVTFDWGPGGTLAELPAGIAWEQAARLQHESWDCNGVTSGDTTITTASCLVNVTSAVTEAAFGDEGGVICVEVQVVDELIDHVAITDESPDCPFDYASQVFDPFGAWLEVAHPEVTLAKMYGDRTSAEGLALWEQYVAEFLGDQPSG